MNERFSEEEKGYMRIALSLARRGMGNTWPNPSVGCVLVRDGRIVGRGWTQPGGRPHAETQALVQAGDAARGAKAYVTLEPCSHYGKTAPCALALINAGVRCVVAAAADPDERVSGRGFSQLRDAGITVSVGLCAEEALSLNAGYLLRQKMGRPLVTLKVASTLDGKIATRRGESQWITGEAARLFVHRLRAEHDAIAVGLGTILADDPLLTCRLPGWKGYRKGRVVFDSCLRIAPESALVASCSEQCPVWVVGCEGRITAERRQHLHEKNIAVISVVDDGCGRPALGEALFQLGQVAGITRLFVEGGGVLAAAFLDAGLVDSIVWFHAPGVIGGDGISAVTALAERSLGDIPRFYRRKTMELDQDAVSFLERLG